MTRPGVVLLLVSASLGLITSVNGHSYNFGACPQFTPMPDFDWEKVKIFVLLSGYSCCIVDTSQFSNGIWYPVAKTSTSGRCLTESFVKNENGFKSLKQVISILNYVTNIKDRKFRQVSLLLPDHLESMRKLSEYPLILTHNKLTNQF